MKYALVCLSGKPRRFSGFLHSVAMEVAPGTFLAADFDRAAFERIWAVLEEWHLGWPELDRGGPPFTSCAPPTGDQVPRNAAQNAC